MQACTCSVIVSVYQQAVTAGNHGDNIVVYVTLMDGRGQLKNIIGMVVTVAHIDITAVEY